MIPNDNVGNSESPSFQKVKEFIIEINTSESYETQINTELQMDIEI